MTPEEAKRMAADIATRRFGPPENNGQGQVEEERRADLEILDIGEIFREVDAMPPPGWLAQPVWPADAYGVIAAEDKAGKSWAGLDLAVAVASGTPWMGVYPTGAPRPVLLFLGEGGKRKTVRRLRAVARAKGVDPEELIGKVRICHRVPHLTKLDHLAHIGRELETNPAALVIVDPLYLAARGAQGSDLYGMGAHLLDIQIICQDAGAALVVVTHFNKTGEGRGAKRITGVGPGAWGRVLATAHVEHRHTDQTTKATVVVLAWEFMGDEIPETDLRIRRWVWAEDPNDLASPMHYEVDVIDEAPPKADTGTDGLSPADLRVLAVLESDPDRWREVRQIGDVLAHAEGRPLKRRTIAASLDRLRDRGLAEEDGSQRAHRWRVPRLGQLDVFDEMDGDEVYEETRRSSGMPLRASEVAPKWHTASRITMQKCL